MIPYDGSKYSKKAAEEAVKIAQKFGSDLYFLTVVDKLRSSLLNKTMNAKDTKKLEKYLKEATSKIDLTLRDEVFKCKEVGINADYEIIKGSPAVTILEFAKKRGIDLIVMGSQGLSGIQKLRVLGSVSRKVSENASCPVLLIR